MTQKQPFQPGSLEDNEKDIQSRIAEIESEPKINLDAVATIDAMRQALLSAENVQRGQVLRGFILSVTVWAKPYAGDVRGIIEHQLPGASGLSVRRVEFRD